jgi:hypothetical protein
MGDIKTAIDHDDAWNKQTVPPLPHAWIQWKGTDVCMGVDCLCGKHFHIDANFAYYVKCPYCQVVYFCNGYIELIKMEHEPDGCIVTDEQAEARESFLREVDNG